MEEIQEMSHKKKRFEKDIISLESFAVDFADKAEKQGKLTLIDKYNALRRNAKEKEKSVKEIDELLQEKYKELTN
jgi:KaiC/GvpD/RAD55 family RecA-like ATPase